MPFVFVVDVDSFHRRVNEKILDRNPLVKDSLVSHWDDSLMRALNANVRYSMPEFDNRVVVVEWKTKETDSPVDFQVKDVKSSVHQHRHCGLGWMIEPEDESNAERDYWLLEKREREFFLGKQKNERLTRRRRTMSTGHTD